MCCPCPMLCDLLCGVTTCHWEGIAGRIAAMPLPSPAVYLPVPSVGTGVEGLLLPATPILCHACPLSCLLIIPACLPAFPCSLLMPALSLLPVWDTYPVVDSACYTGGRTPAFCHLPALFVVKAEHLGWTDDPMDA